MDKKERPFAWTVDILRRANLRPTCQRMGLVKLLYGNGNRHICAEQLYREAKNTGMNLSLATVYNTLNQFKNAGILQEILTGGGKTYFDTTMTPHAHIFCESQGYIEDIAEQDLKLELSDDLMRRMQGGVIEIVVRIP